MCVCHTDRLQIGGEFLGMRLSLNLAPRSFARVIINDLPRVYITLSVFVTKSARTQGERVSIVFRRYSFHFRGEEKGVGGGIERKRPCPNDTDSTRTRTDLRRERR